MVQIEDKINDFLAFLEGKKVEIKGETCFLCNDGAVLIVPNEREAVDIILVRNPVKVDYNLNITNADVQRWKDTDELVEALGEEE